MELATLRGATVAGIDASDRLVAVARQRLPGADIRVGDMHALPWEDGSLRRGDQLPRHLGHHTGGPRGGAPRADSWRPAGLHGVGAHQEVHRVPGRCRRSGWPDESKVENQANMVALGRPGVGEELLARHGFEDVSRMTVPFAWEFADPESYARTLASTGPAYEAIQAVGEEEFLRWATEMAREHVRDGLPLRAEIDVVGYLARAPEQRASASRRGRLEGCRLPRSGKGHSRGARLPRGGRRGPRLRDERQPGLGPPACRGRRPLRADGPGEVGRLAVDASSGRSS